MICTISSRGSPLPPGHWCEAFNFTSAALAEPVIATATTMAVVEMSARIVLVIVRFLPLAYSSAGTAAQSARLLLSGNTSPGWPACPALHTRFAKVHACSEILHAHKIGRAHV